MRTEAKIRVTVAATAFAGAAAVAAVGATTLDRGFGHGWILAAFTTLLALSWAYPILVPRGEDSEAYQLDEGFYVAMALVLPPVAVLVAFAIGTTASQLYRRRPAQRIVFNLGQALLAASAAIGVTALTGRGTLAAVLGSVAYFATSTLVVARVIAFADRTTMFAVITDGIAFRGLVALASVALGLLTGLGSAAHEWAVLLALPPLGLVQLVLAGSLRARLDRARIDRLFKAAVETHASVRVGDVEAALLRSTQELLDAKDARIQVPPPSPDEIGVLIEGPHDRFLVASGRRGGQPFSRHDHKLLEALGAVGSSALENARLVEEVKHQAFHDALTGLPNVALFEDRLSLALLQGRRTGAGVGVIFLDLDRFKKINDSLGHHAGNELLRQVAYRLGWAVREGDTVARQGGDEFTILLSGSVTDADAERVAHKIMETLRRPFTIEGRSIVITASLGIVVALEGRSTAAEMLKHADAAMYRAKERGRDRAQMFDGIMNIDSSARLTLEADLHAAVENGDLQLVYQPQVALESDRIVAVEALVRWTHPVLGPIEPQEFISLAEENGLIVELDAWVLRTACRQAKAWFDAGRPLRIAVNLSAADFERSDVHRTVAEALVASDLPPWLLELEVTESVALGEETDVRKTLHEIRELGVHIAIDDFGTGYSMLGRLQRLPLDRLKIDRSFIGEIVDSAAQAPIVQSLIEMAHRLGLEVVAEGVETRGQLEFLADHGCELVQGYLVSTPVSAEAIEDLATSDRVRSLRVRHAGIEVAATTPSERPRRMRAVHP